MDTEMTAEQKVRKVWPDAHVVRHPLGRYCSSFEIRVPPLGIAAGSDLGSSLIAQAWDNAAAALASPPSQPAPEIEVGEAEGCAHWVDYLQMARERIASRDIGDLASAIAVRDAACGAYVRQFCKTDEPHDAKVIRWLDLFENVAALAMEAKYRVALVAAPIEETHSVEPEKAVDIGVGEGRWN